jgi:two-component system, LuxR family, sensor kinase FixL
MTVSRSAGVQEANEIYGEMRLAFSGRIKTVLFATIGALTLLLAVGGAYETVSLYNKHEAAERAAASNHVSDLLLRAAGQWAVERGATTGYLNAPAPATAEQMRSIGARRAAGDKALAQALDEMKVRHTLDDASPVWTVQHAFAQIQVLRRRIDENLMRPRQARDPALRRDWFPAATYLIEASQALRLAAEFDSNNVEARLAQLQALKHYAWIMSEYAGRERAVLDAAITAQTRLSATELRRLMVFRGRVEMAWDAIEAVDTKSTVPPEVSAAIEDVRRSFFGDFQPTRDAVYAAATTTGTYPIAAATWFDRSTAAIDTILRLGATGGEAADRLATRSSRLSFERFLASLALALIGIGTGAVSLWVVHRRIVGPIRAITTAMTRLAEGDMAVAVPHLGRRDEIGDMAASLQTFRDKLSGAVKQSERRFRAVFDNAVDGLIDINEHGMIEAFNPACERIFGYTAAEVIGQNVKMLMPEPCHGAHDGYIGRYMATGKTRIIGTTGREVQAKRKDGSTFPMDLAIGEFAAADGRHFCGIVRDVTLRKRGEESVALLAAIVTSSDDAIISKNADGVITSWNAGATRLFGHSADDATGKHIGLIIPPELRDEERRIIARILAGESIDNFETVRLNKDGRRIDVSLSISPVRDKTGHIVGAAKAARDISARKRQEADLARYVEALERSNKELDDFAYIASHDLKEPLRGLFNNARFLHEDYIDKLDTEGVSRLLRLGYLSQRMEKLVDDLLYFSRLGRQELAVQWTDLNGVIDEIAEMSETTLKEQNAAIVMPRPLPRLQCDKTRIAEVFRNLITNAVKYNDNAVKRVEIGHLDVIETSKGLERDVFYVRDNGIGIAEEFHEDVFRIFKRLNVEDEDKKGTGVGLTFVQKIIERHGGRIWLDSAPGQGTTFYFTIAKGMSYDAAA